jgi:aspartyl-tRNA(Asn)/glutamyl-tRNA(Gln) amidotransferase subunit C
MTIDDATLLHLAKLSRLYLAAEELPALRDDLQRMVAFIEKLAEVDTDTTAPLHHASNTPERMRDDLPQPAANAADVVVLSEAHNGSFFTVPKVIS